jgi:predicted DCC family thiol-disulfide oxidoreductase YuxK
VILFDGHCNLCNASADFILSRDPRRNTGMPFFKLAAIQSEAGRRFLETQGVDLDPNVLKSLSSVVLIKDDGKVYTDSDAALRIATGLRMPWPLLGWAALWFVPKVIRDAVYHLVACNRLLLFGHRDACRMPSPGDAASFLS